jgi:jumonji domain-containing protein 2
MSKKPSDSISSSGQVKMEESDPPEYPWPKSPESYSSVAESNDVFTEGEESDVEGHGSGLEPGEIPVLLSEERNSFKIPSVCGSIYYYCIPCILRMISENTMLCI